MGATMRGILLTLTFIALGVAHEAAAAKSEFQLTPRAGVGYLRIDDAQLENQPGRIATDTLGLGVGIGVLTPVGVVLEAGVDSYGNFDVFDSIDEFTVTQQFVSIGYQFELGDGWRIVPRFGRTRWELKNDEGRLFDFDDDRETHTIRGYDYYWEASVSRRISRVLTLGVGYKQGNFDFGRTHSTSFMMTFGW
jgi:hypothetical protein